MKTTVLRLAETCLLATLLAVLAAPAAAVSFASFDVVKPGDGRAFVEKVLGGANDVVKDDDFRADVHYYAIEGDANFANGFVVYENGSAAVIGLGYREGSGDFRKSLADGMQRAGFGTIDEGENYVTLRRGGDALFVTIQADDDTTWMYVMTEEMYRRSAPK